MPFENGQKKNVFEESIIFETEIDMYTQVLPRFEQILRDVGDDTILKAPILFHELSPRKIIIFEDIVPLGYELLRGRYTNVEEIKQSYIKLAKWHTLSYKEPGCFDEYHISIFAMPNLDRNLLMWQGTDAFIQQLETMPKMQKYLPFIQSIQGKLFEDTKRTAKEYFDAPKEDAIYVLYCGDFHDKCYI
ncbi:PREDICTED: uncharacterized protein LOC108966000 isoform X2 [Bactrocera latifrons]|uniref:uncharacterized protein LOC108966000 isoform X2 n=1 Tax=Bactrocera latifrons TaxID=174628 RepID=UPI0008DE9B15|nr:PREDICTED: uncharacterized protein LOC108966000 isoform X2 [Bactrocera latifrons]